MALANIGVLLARWGKKTLLVDWDLEAPGLENYFKTIILNDPQNLDKSGVIDILHQKNLDPLFNIQSINWNEYLIPIPFENNPNLFLLKSGKNDDQYIDKVRQFDFSEFYDKHEGGDFLEDLRSYWKKEFDFILIDSRTGLTDSSRNLLYSYARYSCLVIHSY
jgi:cellulose biosynthesis protein BcsQ